MKEFKSIKMNLLLAFVFYLKIRQNFTSFLRQISVRPFRH
jgi:hypothetical protein